MMVNTTVLSNSLNNAWEALAKEYADAPDESVRIAMNLLSKIIGKVEHDLFEVQSQLDRKQQEIELKDWIQWLKEA